MTQIELLFYFLRLGCTGFGGPLALLAMMQKELIEERKLIPSDEFHRALAMIKSLPGPVAVQMVAFLCYRTFGVATAVLAVVLFVLPAALLLCLLAIFYKDFQASPFLEATMAGMQGAALILIASSLQPLTKNYAKKPLFWMMTVAAVVLMLAQWIEPVVIVLMAASSVLIMKRSATKSLKSMALLELLWVCVKAGGLAFGTGLAIIPMLRADFVGAHHWVTDREFLDALAFGQMTPGPVSVTVTFVGYRMAGWLGAVVATVGIFAPGVINMVTWFPRANLWMSRQQWIHDFVQGAIAAIAAGILLAIFVLAKEIPWPQMLIPVVLFIVGLRISIPSWFMVISSGVLWALVQQALIHFS